MKVGDYVRTEDGVKKVLKYTYNKKYENGHCVWFDNKDYGILFTDEEVNKMKPSPNIIDLIEVGDYVNGMLVTNIWVDKETGNIEFEFNNHESYLYPKSWNYESRVTKYKIKSIVTKEQFSQMEYKAGD